MTFQCASCQMLCLALACAAHACSRAESTHLVLDAAVVPVDLHEHVVPLAQQVQIPREVLRGCTGLQAVHDLGEALQLPAQGIMQMPVHEIDRREALAAHDARRISRDAGASLEERSSGHAAIDSTMYVLKGACLNATRRHRGRQPTACSRRHADFCLTTVWEVMSVGRFDKKPQFASRTRPRGWRVMSRLVTLRATTMIFRIQDRSCRARLGTTDLIVRSGGPCEPILDSR